MSTLVLVACLHLTCQPFEIPVESCALGSQIDLQAWSALHPDWVIKRWGCQLGSRA